MFDFLEGMQRLSSDCRHWAGTMMLRIAPAIWVLCFIMFAADLGGSVMIGGKEEDLWAVLTMLPVWLSIGLGLAWASLDILSTSLIASFCHYQEESGEAMSGVGRIVMAVFKLALFSIVIAGYLWVMVAKVGMQFGMTVGPVIWLASILVAWFIVYAIAGMIASADEEPAN